MRVLRRLSLLVGSLAAVGALWVPTAFASSSPFKKGGEPTCTVTIASISTSTTICTGSLAGGGLNGQQWLANLDVSGFAVYQCLDSTGARVPGQNQVTADTSTSTPFWTTSKNTTFTTDQTVLTAPATVSATQGGCASGSTAVDPALTTTRIELLLTLPTGSFAATSLVCTASNPNGLSGTVVLTC